MSPPSVRPAAPLLVLLALLLLPATLGAQVSLEELQLALDDRVAELKAQDALSKAEKGERNQLRKASQRIGQFLKQEDKAGDKLVQKADELDDFLSEKALKRLKLLRTAARALDKAQSADAEVLAQELALFEQLVAAAGFQRQRAEGLQDMLQQEDSIDEIGLLIEDGDLLVEEAAVAWPLAPTAPDQGLREHAAELLIVATQWFADVVGVAMERRQADAEQFPNDLVVPPYALGENFLPDTLFVGHPVSVNYYAELLQPVDELTLRLILVETGAWDAALAALDDKKKGKLKTPPEQYIVDEVTLTELIEPPVTEGSGSDFVIAEEIPEGSYYAGFVVDPYDRHLELASDEAEANNVVISTDKVVTVSHEYKDVPNLSLIYPFPEVNDPVDVEEGPGGLANTFGLSLTVTTYGLQPVEGASIQVHVQDALFEPDWLKAAQVFDPETGLYGSGLVLPTLTPGEPLDIQLDVRVPAPIPQELLDDPTVTAVAVIDPNDLITEFDTFPWGFWDNQGWTTVNLLDEPPPPPPEELGCSKSLAFDKDFGSEHLTAAVSFQSDFDIYKDVPPAPDGWQPNNHADGGAGAVAQAEADVILEAFDLDPVPLVSFDAFAERDPIQKYSYLGVEMLFLPDTPLETVLYEFGPYDSPELQQIFEDNAEDLPPGLEYDEDGQGFTWDLSEALSSDDDDEEEDDDCPDDVDIGTEWKVCKQTEKERWFFPGGFPVKITGTLTGVLGFVLRADAIDSVLLTAGPAALVEAGVEAKSCLGKICVGAKGAITLLKDEFFARMGAGLDVDSNGSGTNIDMGTCLTVTNDLVAGKGRLYAYADFPKWDTCWKKIAFVWIPYPCNFRMAHAEKTLLKMPGFDAQTTLLDISGQYCCKKISGNLACDNDFGACDIEE